MSTQASVGARSFLTWTQQPRPDRGVSFARRDGGWERWSYVQLAEAAKTVAGSLQERGVRHEDVVVVVLRGARPFVSALYGGLLAGATVSPVSPPNAFHEPDAYRVHLERVLRIARPAAVICDEATHTAVSAVAPALEIDVAELERGDRRYAGERARLALLQFTSGSSSQPRGVRIPHAALDVNVETICEWVGLNVDTPSAHWLPLHHDMGLIGGLITPMSQQCELFNLRPGDFIRDPLRYLRCFSEQGAEIGTMPNFGLDQVIRRVHPRELAGQDFSELRTIIVGAERLIPAVFERFTDLLGQFGMRRSVLTPAYGLAEATLAVAGCSVASEPLYASVDLERSRIVPRPSAANDSVVGCGAPLPGMSVAIVDEQGEQVSDGAIGEIVIRGPSLADGYEQGPTAQAPGTSGFARDGLHTGDAGFLLEDQLYVLGRWGDSMKLHGRPVFAEDLELAVLALGLPTGSVAVLLGTRRDRPTAVAVLEEADPASERSAHEVLGGRLGAEADVVVLSAPFRTIERTTSGKPRRQRMWRRFLDGELGSANDVAQTPQALETVAGASS
jgi:acyl-CoA synthetase (AMP-forming)/AMP-acid ligase II